MPWSCRIVAVFCLGACIPDANLADERQGSGAPPGGIPAPAGIGLVQPPDGATLVPINLSAVIVRVPEPVQTAEPTAAPFDIEDERGGGPIALAATSGACTGSTATVCYKLALAQGLAPGSRYRVLVASGTTWSDGRPVDPAPVGAFSTAAGADDTPPMITGMTVDVSDCARVRFTLTEPADAVVVFSAGDASEELAAPADGMTFDLLAPLVRLPPGVPGTIVVRATDAAGNQTSSPAVPFDVPARVAPLVMTEILANPAGSEYTQEWIEILNIGSDPVSLGGFVIEDSGGFDTLPVFALASGQRALIVAAGYLADDIADPKPAAEALLVRVEGRIGRDGLANADEAFVLRDPEGRVVSRFPGLIDMSSTRWNGRSAQRVPADLRCDDPDLWTRDPQRPTPGF